MWSPLPLAVETHFILIFSLASSSQNSSANVATSLLARREMLPASRLGSAHSLSPFSTPSPSPFHTPSPQFYTPSSSFHTPSPPPPPITFSSHVSSTSGVPFDANNTALQLSSHVSSTGGVPFDANNTALQQLSHNNSTGMASLEALCEGFGIGPNTITAAKCNPVDKDKSLLAMVVHHRAMVHILVTLGYHDRNNPFTKGKVVKFNNGLELLVENVLQSFDTYKCKLKWYSWAEDVASNSEWNESTGTYLHFLLAPYTHLNNVSRTQSCFI